MPVGADSLMHYSVGGGRSLEPPQKPESGQLVFIHKELHADACRVSLHQETSGPIRSRVATQGPADRPIGILRAQGA
jgi:hypothetical protein